MKWLKEANEKHWTYQGVQCHILRVPEMQHLCGYISVPEGHPWRNENIEGTVETHGGITFQGILKRHQDYGYCVGFDCAHAGDLIPGIIEHRAFFGRSQDVYRDMDYVTAGVETLASAMLDAAKPADENYYIITQEEADKLRAISDLLQGGTDRERDYGHKLWRLHQTMTDCPAKRGDVI